MIGLFYHGDAVIQIWPDIAISGGGIVRIVNSQWRQSSSTESENFRQRAALKGGVMVTSPAGIARSENLGTIMPTSI